MKYSLMLFCLILFCLGCKKDSNEDTIPPAIVQLLVTDKGCPPLGIRVDLVELENGELAYGYSCTSHLADCAYVLVDKEAKQLNTIEAKFVRTLFTCSD